MTSQAEMRSMAKGYAGDKFLGALTDGIEANRRAALHAGKDLREQVNKLIACLESGEDVGINAAFLSHQSNALIVSASQYQRDHWTLAIALESRGAQVDYWQSDKRRT